MQTVTDLACELLRRTPHQTAGLKTTTTRQAGVLVQTTTITTTATAHAIGKPIGVYLNLDTTDAKPRHIARVLHQAVAPLITKRDKILIVGLGNDKFVADSLGPRVLEQIKTGARMVTFQPCVFGVTGIDSVQAIQAMTRLVRPSAVIVIDSLVSASPTRIGTNYQICTSGITPGSGLGRDRRTINRRLLGVPVIAIGVPVCTVMTLPQNKIYHVVPKDIDMVIRDCATLIARSINTLVSQSRYGVTRPWLSGVYQRHSSSYPYG